MISIQHRTTAQTPSCLGMPGYGSAFGTAGTAALVTVVRDRVAGAARRTAIVPGTSAWRPPTC